MDEYVLAEKQPKIATLSRRDLYLHILIEGTFLLINSDISTIFRKNMGYSGFFTLRKVDLAGKS